MILSPTVVGRAKTVQKTALIKAVNEEYTEFVNKRGKFAKNKNMWLTAGEEDLSAARWHYNYTVPSTKVLGKLACLVLSKIAGGGSAERLWKIRKFLSKGQRASLGNDKAKKQTLIYARYQEKKARARKNKLSAAGVLWEDADFDACKMDMFCQEIVDELGEHAPPSRYPDYSSDRVFRAWQENWEKKKIGPGGDPVHKARLVRKYAGLYWLDIDNGNKLLCADQRMVFDKKRGENKYHIFAKFDGFDGSKSAEEQEDEWNVWSFEGTALYELITDYYEDKDGVTVYQKDDDCGSEEE